MFAQKPVSAARALILALAAQRLEFDLAAHDQPAALIPISGEIKDSRRAGCHELRPL
jgi:hypothetical protein